LDPLPHSPPPPSSSSSNVVPPLRKTSQPTPPPSRITSTTANSSARQERPAILKLTSATSPLLQFSNEFIFFLHPNAPRSYGTPTTPLYARPPPSSSPRHFPQGPSRPFTTSFPSQYPNIVPSGSMVRMLHQTMAAAACYTAPNGRTTTTIYGRTEFDLISAGGPVPIAFSLDPPPVGSASPRGPPSPLGS
jgi:TBC1 domain family member 10